MNSQQSEHNERDDKFGRVYDQISTKANNDEKMSDFDAKFAENSDNLASPATGPHVGDRPSKGVVYYVLSTVLMSANLYCAQGLFKSASHVAIMQLTFVRGVVCSLMVLLMINRNLKKTLWDPVDRRTMPSLIFRCLQGGISVYISFSSINFFNVSTVGIVCSLKPIIACLLGVTMLGEKMSLKDVVCMSAVFIAVFLVIFGAEGSDQASMATVPWAMIALVS